MFTIKREKIKLDQPLGKGGFGTVYPYQRNKDDKEWVVKIAWGVPHKDLSTTIQEIVIGFRCNHPNVLPIKGYNLLAHPEENYASNDEMWKKLSKWDVLIKLPRMKESLHSKMDRYKKSKKPFLEEEIFKLFYETSCGLHYLHRKKIAHRDLKPENILLNDEDTACIADVGLAKFTEDETNYTLNEIAGTVTYIGPEITPKSKKKELFPSDVWSLGLIILEICCLPEKANQTLLLNGEEKQEEFKKTIDRLSCRPFLKDLLYEILQCKPENRPTIEKIEERLRDMIKTDPKLSKLIKTKEKQNEKRAIECNSN